MGAGHTGEKTHAMKLSPIILMVLLLVAGCASGPAPVAGTTSWPADAPEAHGKISAYIVMGEVQLQTPEGTRHALVRGERFEEGSTLVVSPGGNALLVFSNGTTMKVTEGTELVVVKFRQAPYDEKSEGTFLRLSKDPSRSNVLLELRKGTLQGEVKKLNTEAGSSFMVLTPAGAVEVQSGQPLKATAMDSTGRYRTGSAPEWKQMAAFPPLPPPGYEQRASINDCIYKLAERKSPGDGTVTTLIISCFTGQLNFQTPVSDSNVAGGKVTLAAGREFEAVMKMATTPVKSSMAPRERLAMAQQVLISEGVAMPQKQWEVNVQSFFDTVYAAISIW